MTDASFPVHRDKRGPKFVGHHPLSAQSSIAHPQPKRRTQVETTSHQVASIAFHVLPLLIPGTMEIDQLSRERTIAFSRRIREISHFQSPLSGFRRARRYALDIQYMGWNAPTHMFQRIMDKMRCKLTFHKISRRPNTHLMAPIVCRKQNSVLGVRIRTG